jgi:DegV family protein with EDD domain
MSTTNRVAIVTDSACDLSDEELAKHEIELVPLAIRFGEAEYIDKVELSNDEFWARSEASDELPATAAPSAQAFAEAYRKAKDQGATGVVCLTLSSLLSATFQAAIKGVEEVSDIPVTVVDTLSCSAAQGLLVLEASRRALAGEDAETIVAAIEEQKGRTKLYGTLDTLDNLKKGGRIGAAGAFFASLLSVKPVISIVDGEVKPESRQRTRRRSIEHLVSIVAEQSPVESIAVAHSNAPDIDVFVNLLSHVNYDQPLPVSKIGPVIGTHGGPRLLAVAFTTPKK